MGPEETIDEEGFLAGPDGEADIDVDPVFAKTWANVVSDMDRHRPGWSAFDPTRHPAVPSAVNGIILVDVDGMVLAWSEAEDRPVGGMVGCDLCVRDDLRGRGLGTDIVLEHYARNGSLPTWHLDVPAYSPAGEATVRAAWREMSRRPEAFAERVRRAEAEVRPGLGHAGPS